MNKNILKKLKKYNPKIAVILGSGFNNNLFLEDKVEFDYSKLGINCQQILGHERKLIVGKHKGISTVIASRVHYYENGETSSILQLYKLFKEIGIEIVVATTATGGINNELEAGDLMLIKSHINLTGTNPLISQKPITFVDLSNAYNKKLRDLSLKTAKKLKIPLFEGIHIQTSGPSYETFGEVIAFRKMGADTVSMSMALDAICACAVGLKFLAFAGVTNKAVTEDSQPLNHEEVLKIASNISQNFFKIIDNLWLKLV